MAPLDLPRVLMRGSAAVLAALWLLAALTGLWRTQADAHEEMQSAMALAATLQRLAVSAPLDDEALLAALRPPTGTEGDGEASRLRHLRLTLRDADGRLLLGGRADPPAAPPVEWLVSLQRRLAGERDPAPLAWTLPRPQGEPWTAVLSPTPDSERREAIGSLLQNLGLLAAGAAGLLALLRWQLHRALRPLQALLARIDPGRSDEAGGSDEAGAKRPPMPPTLIRELQLIADALDRAETQRRVLAQRLQSLQEDERRRLAQELHDELGQRLTALRLDATVLQRRLQGDEAAAALAQDLSRQVQAAQQEVRELLARLAPRSDARLPAQRLRELLTPLAAAQRGLVVELDCEPGDDPLPEALLQAVYRLSQEGLTNVVRHAGATHAWLRVRRTPTGALHWSLRDNGRGPGDAGQRPIRQGPGTEEVRPGPDTDTTGLGHLFARGSGLAGMRERAWAYGGDLQIRDARPGLALSTTLAPPPDNPAP